MKTLIAICVACCLSVITAFPMYKHMPFAKGFGGIPCPRHGMHGGFGGGPIQFGGQQLGFGGVQGGFDGDFIGQYDSFNDNSGVVTSVGRRGFQGQWGDDDFNNDIFNNDQFGNDQFGNDRFGNDRFGNDDNGFFGNDNNGFFGNDDSRISFGRPIQRGAVLSNPIGGGAFQTLPGQGTVFSPRSTSGRIQRGGILRDDFNNGFDDFGVNDDLRRIQDQISHKK